MNSGERLERLMVVRGIASRADLARAAGLAPGTVRQHILRGSVPKDAAPAYARALNTTPDWLLYGRGVSPLGETPSSAVPSPLPTPASRPALVPATSGSSSRSVLAEVAEISREIDRLEERLAELRRRLGTVAA